VKDFANLFSASLWMQRRHKLEMRDKAAQKWGKYEKE